MDLQQTPNEMQKKVTLLEGITYGVLVVMTGIVIGFVLDYWDKERISYQDLIDKVNSQNVKIDLLYMQSIGKDQDINIHYK